MNQYLNDQLHNKIFCIMANASIGGTFLEWSIHWLLGTSEYFHSVKKNLPLVDNPLTKINAHAHIKNHVDGLDKNKKTINILKLNFSNNWKSLYPCLMEFSTALPKLNCNIDTLGQLSAEEWKNLNDYIINDYSDVWEHCYKENIFRIFLYLNPADTLYQRISTRAHDRQLLKAEPYLTEDDELDDFSYHFFSDSMKMYDNNTLSNLPRWDQREILALNLRPYTNSVNLLPKLNFTNDHKFINAKQLWHNGEETLLEIIDYLGQSVVKSRLPQWREVYKQWQVIQFKILKFMYDIDHIVMSIVNNWYYDLKPYELTLRQEAIIQHILIYKHKLTIKNWKLEKFPNNTKDLHKLLEPSFYTVENIYNI